MPINANIKAISWNLLFSSTWTSWVSQTLVDGVALIFYFFYDGIVLGVYDNIFGWIVFSSFLMQGLSSLKVFNPDKRWFPLSLYELYMIPLLSFCI